MFVIHYRKKKNCVIIFYSIVFVLFRTEEDPWNFISYCCFLKRNTRQTLYFLINEYRALIIYRRIDSRRLLLGSMEINFLLIWNKKKRNKILVLYHAWVTKKKAIGVVMYNFSFVCLFKQQQLVVNFYSIHLLTLIWLQAENYINWNWRIVID